MLLYRMLYWTYCISCTENRIKSFLNQSINFNWVGQNNPSELLIIGFWFYFKVFFEIFKFKMFFLYSSIFCECTQFNLSNSHYAYSFILIILSIASVHSIYLEKEAQKNFENFLQQHTLVLSWKGHCCKKMKRGLTTGPETNQEQILIFF